MSSVEDKTRKSGGGAIDVRRSSSDARIGFRCVDDLARISHQMAKIGAASALGWGGVRGGWLAGLYQGAVGVLDRGRPLSAATFILGVSEGGVGQPEMGEGELGLTREGGGHGHLDSPAAGADESTDLQKPQADRAAGGLGELGVGEADPA
jgi:hypothetical protein